MKIAGRNNILGSIPVNRGREEEEMDAQAEQDALAGAAQAEEQARSEAEWAEQQAADAQHAYEEQGPPPEEGF